MKKLAHFFKSKTIMVSVVMLALALGIKLSTNVLWVPLWTDLLVYLLVVSVVGFGEYATSKPHLRDQWQQVLRSRTGMASMVVLLVYVAIGLIDSIHFREPLPPSEQKAAETQYSPEVLSVLDIVLSTIRNANEKTYSAPFSAFQFTKETVETESGVRERYYPRLKHGGAHLQNPQDDIASDIVSKFLLGLLIGVIACAGIVAIMAVALAYHWRVSWSRALQNMVRGNSTVQWPVVIGTIAILCMVAGATGVLSNYYHIFGTDKVGEDVFYQSLKSVRTGLLIGSLTTLVMLPFAVLLGIMAGYFKGWIDDVIQYLYTTLNSIPGVLLIAAAILMLQVYIANHPDLFTTDAERSDLRLFFLCLILGITSWTGLCRLLRGETLKIGELEYVQAARAFGVSNFKIINRHILPNVLHIVLIAVVLDFSGLVLAEAVLSYVGVGVDPTMQSWGNMINGARLEMAREPMVWWSLAAAFVFMFVLVLAANLFSDVVRDAFDPRIRKQ